MRFQQLNNGESGSLIRAKLNSMLSELITGAEGNIELWRSILTITRRLGELSDAELSTKYLEIIRQGKDYTDTKVSELYSFVSAANGLVDVATSLDYQSKLTLAQGGLVLTPLYGTFPNIHLTIPKPAGPCLFILYKAAGGSLWKYTALELGVSFEDNWGNGSNVGITQKFLTENALHKESIVGEFLKDKAKVPSTDFITEITGMVNVDAIVPLTTGTYTKDAARGAVPQNLRRNGLIITYATAKEQVIEQFVGTPQNWSDSHLWVNITQKFRVYPFSGFLNYTGNVEAGVPSDINAALIKYNKKTSSFVYSFGGKIYNVSDTRYLSTSGVFPESVLYMSSYGVVFSSVNSTKVIEYAFPAIVDNLTTDSSDKVLSAAQGVKILALLNEGYKFFGELQKTHTTYKNHQVKGFYILTQGGEYPNVQVAGKSLNAPAWSFLIVDNGNLEVLKAPEFALQKDLKDLKTSVDNIETIKTRVLTESAYNDLVTNGSVEMDRFYFTYEE